jgi:death-on-curing protein
MAVFSNGSPPLEMEVVYLSREQVLAIHDATLEEHGGAGGILSEDGLNSAIEMPKSTVFGQDAYPTLLDKAGAYLFFLTSSHAFRDGNKRTGLAAAFEFLSINGFALDIPSDRWNDAEGLVLRIASGELTRTQALAQFEDFVRTI